MSQRGIAEIASEVELAAGAWTVVVCDTAHLPSVLDELAEELEYALERDDGELVRLNTRDGAQLLGRTVYEKRSQDVVLTGDADEFDAAAWRALDQARTRFVGRARVVLVMTERGLTGLARHAPHLWSWLNARVFEVDLQAEKLRVEARLESLREGTGLTDDELIQRAEAGELVADPVHVEWLVLLGKGDLVGC